MKDFLNLLDNFKLDIVADEFIHWDSCTDTIQNVPDKLIGPQDSQ